MVSSTKIRKQIETELIKIPGVRDKGLVYNLEVNAWGYYDNIKNQFKPYLQPIEFKINNDARFLSQINGSWMNELFISLTSGQQQSIDNWLYYELIKIQERGKKKDKETIARAIIYKLKRPDISKYL